MFNVLLTVHPDISV